MVTLGTSWGEATIVAWVNGGGRGGRGSGLMHMSVQGHPGAVGVQQSHARAVLLSKPPLAARRVLTHWVLDALQHQHQTSSPAARKTQSIAAPRSTRAAGRAKGTGVLQSPEDGPQDLKYTRCLVHLRWCQHWECGGPRQRLRHCRDRDTARHCLSPLVRRMPFARC